MKLRSVPGRRGVAVAAAVVTLGLGTGAAAAAGLASAQRAAADAALALRTAAVHAAVDTMAQRYADTIQDLAALAAVRPESVAAVGPDRLPGAQHVLVVAADHRVRFRHVLDGTAPPPLTAVPAGTPLTRTLRAARDSGRTVAGDPLVLPADRSLPAAHRQTGFDLVAPVATGPYPGWVVVSVRAGDLLAAALDRAGVTGVDATLSAAAPDGSARALAHWSDGAAHPGSAAVTVTVTTSLAGQPWQVHVRPTTELTGAARRAAAPLTMLAATLISGLLAAVALGGVARRDRDAARTRRAAAERAAALDRADRAEQAVHDREAELTGFAAAAAENLHAPLHIIAGFTELLREETGARLDPASRGFLDRIGSSTARMLTVVDELLAYTATMEAALKLEPVDVQRLTLDVSAARLHAHAGERPSIDVGDLPVVTADATLLRQVLDHLIGNAVRFVRHGGGARITVGARETTPGWWRIEVADRGIGVPEEYREQIFTPFRRTPAGQGYPGTGLGLAVCRRIVAMHGGEIGVRPNPGGGSVFWFTVSAIGVTVPDAPGELAAF